MFRYLAVLVFSTCATAQDYRARVQGLITDSTQAAVPGAKVVLRNTATGIETNRESGPAGTYLFDAVEPGRYQLTAEIAGFSKAVRDNIVVQTRADVTVDVMLQPGQLTESVTVSASAEGVQLQFNSSTRELTVDGKMLKELPIKQRNPFTLALLDPAVVNRYGAERNPFFMWSSSSIDVGGSTNRKNDLLLDGAPLQLNQKGSYAPPMDAVQEFSVQQNSVDAEFGHSAGGVLSLSIKSGTNSYHGTAYYFGRNPKLNAVTNSVTRAGNLIRNHIAGGTIGGPIRKNKLFTFTSYEHWNTREPRNTLRTMPTDLERRGDFSQSLTIFNTLRGIYDPWTSRLDAANNRATRQPFPGNVIPASRIDPTAARFMQDIWGPNNPGDNVTGVNNFKTSYSWKLENWNFNNRTDWNINEKWKVFGRYSQLGTTLDQDNYTPNNSPAMTNDNG
ncbi:MAG: carboxypeptidase regulatory-like domain-containing protein, partial [Bryobacterales bacterium]|nr:carboxypeptidase regulatory-like domain-containing protein [Bryobacterales bacterium]